MRSRGGLPRLFTSRGYCSAVGAASLWSLWPGKSVRRKVDDLNVDAIAIGGRRDQKLVDSAGKNSARTPETKAQFAPETWRGRLRISNSELRINSVFMETMGCGDALKHFTGQIVPGQGHEISHRLISVDFENPSG